MKPLDRKSLRQEILRELYDHNFSVGWFKDVRQEYNGNLDRKAAYEYLNDKKLIVLDKELIASEGIASKCEAKIVARGIDAIENRYDLATVK